MQELDDVSTLIAFIYGLSACALFVVGIPQGLAYMRHGWGFHDLQVFRLKTSLISNSFACFLLWRAVVYIDFAWYDQRIMGTLGGRWPIELAIGLAVLVAALYAAGLYLYYQRLRNPDDATRGAATHLRQAQVDRMEAIGADTNARLRRSAIGDAEQQIVNKTQADEIQATGEDSLERLRREHIGDEP